MSPCALNGFFYETLVGNAVITFPRFPQLQATDEAARLLQRVLVARGSALEGFIAEQCLCLSPLLLTLNAMSLACPAGGSLLQLSFTTIFEYMQARAYC